MKTKISLTTATLLITLSLLAPHSVRAHCDGMDGPVVKAAQRALADGNVNLVLIWVQPADEAEIRRAFEKTVAVRKLGAEAKTLADQYFFETLVRVHRAGEGAPYTGLKPAGHDYGPAIRAGDEALRTGKLQPVTELLTHQVEHGLHTRFEEAMAAKKFDPKDLKAGRHFVQTYVEYIHYVEGIHQATRRPAAESSHGHTDAKSVAEHSHH